MSMEKDPRLEALDLEARLRRIAPPPEVDVEAALRNVKARFADPEVTDLTEFRRKRPVWQRPAWRAAAGIAVVLGATLIWRAANEPNAGAPLASGQRFETPAEATDSVTLADGTDVVLGPGSTLVVRVP